MADNPSFSKTGLPNKTLDGFAKSLVAQTPLQRFGEPEEIAAAVAFLALNDATFVKGTELPIDSGREFLPGRVASEQPRAHWPRADAADDGQQDRVASK